MKRTLTKLDYLTIVIFSLIGQIAWTMENMFYNLYIVDEFNAGPDSIALMVSLSAIVATFTTLFMGALSDKLGKRKIFMIIGYIVWGIIILSFSFVNGNTIANPTIGIALIIVLDCLMTFFGSTANDASYNAYLTDISSENNRGKIEGINSAMPLIAILIVFAGLSGFAKPGSWNIVFTIVSIVVLLCGILGIFLIKEPKAEKSNESYFKNIFYGFKPSVIKENKVLYIVLIAFAVFCISQQVFMPYYILYLRQNVGSNPISELIGMDGYVVVMAPAIIIASIFTIIYGKVIDKYGFIKSLIPTLIIYFIGLVLLTLSQDVIIMFIGCMLMLSGYLSASAVFSTKIRNHTPENKVGLFQGLRLVAMVLIPMLIGPWIGSVICGGGASFGVVENEDTFLVSKYIFLGAIIVGLFTIIPTMFIRRMENENSK